MQTSEEFIVWVSELAASRNCLQLSDSYWGILAVFTHWAAQQALNGKPWRHWLVSLQVLSGDGDVFLLLSWFLFVSVSFWLFCHSLPALPTLVHPLTPSPFCLSFSAPVLKCVFWYSLLHVDLKATFETGMKGQNSLKRICSWLFGFDLFVVDWREKPATSGKAGTGWAEAAADHPEGRDTARGGSRVSPEGRCSHKGISICTFLKLLFICNCISVYICIYFKWSWLKIASPHNTWIKVQVCVTSPDMLKRFLYSNSAWKLLRKPLFMFLQIFTVTYF